MSYDLIFWREQPGTALDPDAVMSLQDTEEMPGLVPLPREMVAAAFQKQFPDAAIGEAEIEWEGEGSYFQVGFTHRNEQLISSGTIACGFNLLKSESAMSRLQAVIDSLGCRLHDPQTG